MTLNGEHALRRKEREVTTPRSYLNLNSLRFACLVRKLYRTAEGHLFQRNRGSVMEIHESSHRVNDKIKGSAGRQKHTTSDHMITEEVCTQCDVEAHPQLHIRLCIGNDALQTAMEPGFWPNSLMLNRSSFCCSVWELFIATHVARR
jgi:hypothetical protein